MPSEPFLVSRWALSATLYVTAPTREAALAILKEHTDSETEEIQVQEPGSLTEICVNYEMDLRDTAIYADDTWAEPPESVEEWRRRYPQFCVEAEA